MKTLRILSISTLLSFLTLLTLLTLSANAGWVESEMGTAQSLRGFTGTASNLVAVGNTGNLIYSEDSGATWNVVDKFSNVWWLDVVTATNGDLFAVGESGGYVASYNGGVTWTSLSLGVTSNLYDIDKTEDYAYIVGAEGRGLSYSSNSGGWSISTTNVTVDINGVYDAGNGTGWAVTDGGKVLYISSGGGAWTNLGTFSSDDLTAIHFTSSSNGWFVGEKGNFKKTTNTGASWSNVSVSGLTNQHLYDIKASGDNIAVVGDKIVITSADGGETWESHDFSDENFTFYAAYYDANDQLWVSGTNFDTASVIYTFEEEVAEVVEEEIEDESGNSEQETLLREDASDGQAGMSEQEAEAAESNLIKLVCDAGAGVTDPCRAVYYYAQDGKRHAFVNEKSFFTWFDDFDDVVEVSADFMSSIALGKNVTYHPGTKMVKFQSVPTVYAVSSGGELRAIASEAVATDLYGDDWNQQIDDISDAFLGNYSFGEDIESAEDFDVSAEESGVASLDENF